MSRMSARTDTPALADELVAAMLATARVARVATNQPDGSPMIAAFWFVQSDASLYVVSGENETTSNVRRTGWASALFDLGETYADLRGVVVHGEARALGSDPDGAEVRSALTAVRDRYRAELAEQAPLLALSAASPEPSLVIDGSVVLELRPRSAHWWLLGGAVSGRLTFPSRDGS
jgi:nitroimidazol reductase NimA-like FMN-containing flavoprotein (pyridoxamine 5'-phosphate oxidase superfamily)